MSRETVTTYAAMLKEWYTTKRIEQLVLSGCPLLAMLPKNTDIEGESWDVPLLYGDSPAASCTFATGQEHKGGTSTTKFQVTTKNEYAFPAFSRKVMKASRTNKGAFLPAAKPQVDGAFRQVRRSMGISLYRDGSGARAQVSSVSTYTLTLTSRHDCLNFMVGDRVQANPTKSGTVGNMRNSGTHQYITDIDRSAGTITLDGDFGGTVAASDYIYRDGDYDAVITGLGAWIPASAPGSTAFYGVDRSADTDMLGGIRYDGSAQLVHEALIDGLGECCTLGDGQPDHVFVHPIQWRALAKELGSKVEFKDYVVTQKISFRGFEIQYDGGVARVFADRWCENNYAFGLTLSSWELGSMGPCPEMFDSDNDQEMLRESSADGYEMRVGGYVNLACHAPGYNVRITLPTQS